MEFLNFCTSNFYQILPITAAKSVFAPLHLNFLAYYNFLKETFSICRHSPFLHYTQKLIRDKNSIQSSVRNQSYRTPFPCKGRHYVTSLVNKTSQFALYSFSDEQHYFSSEEWDSIQNTKIPVHNCIIIRVYSFIVGRNVRQVQNPSLRVTLCLYLTSFSPS